MAEATSAGARPRRGRRAVADAGQVGQAGVGRRGDVVAGVYGQAALEGGDELVDRSDRTRPARSRGRRLHQPVDDLAVPAPSRDSISTLPAVDATSAGRSLTRGTVCDSPRRSARRSALATSVSWLAIESRTETPERWLTCAERRA